MESLHHGLKFRDLPSAVAGAGVAGIRTKEIRRVIAPVVTKSLLRKMFVRKEGVYRHKFHGRDAEPLQILNGRLRSQAGISASKSFWNLGVAFRETFYVQLIDD